MFLMLGFKWWYSLGWKWAWERAVTARIKWCLEMFSVRDLTFSLFAPFKQTYAGGVRGSLSDHFRAFIDRSVSRVIGFLIRSILIFTGLVCVFFSLVSGVLLLAVWALVPVAPLVALVLIAMGVGK
ncbi:MAG TPA: hypothetical protein PKB09_04015 [Candidatus Saccharibacteria bacterium]|nr:hypothetical protein [Candidatus Saccharibacteria bacterium]